VSLSVNNTVSSAYNNIHRVSLTSGHSNNFQISQIYCEYLTGKYNLASERLPLSIAHWLLFKLQLHYSSIETNSMNYAATKILIAVIKEIINNLKDYLIFMVAYLLI
jgi:hypothetical protein